MRAQRLKRGSVRYDKRRKTWNYLWYDGGKRRSKLIGTKQDYPTKAAGWGAVDRLNVDKPEAHTGETAPSVARLIERYRIEKMPRRYTTRRAYDVWLRLYIQPRWAASRITDIQAR